MPITPAQFSEMQARVAKKSAQIQSVVDAVDRESNLHADIFDECRRRGWIALHGSMSERTHRTPGEFDFVILADKGRAFLVECKARLGKLSPEQLAMKIHAEHLGHKPAVVRSMKEFLEVIK